MSDNKRSRSNVRAKDRSRPEGIYPALAAGAIRNKRHAAMKLCRYAVRAIEAHVTAKKIQRARDRVGAETNAPIIPQTVGYYRVSLHPVLHPNWRIAGDCFPLLEVSPLGPKRSFRMGAAGLRFAQLKRTFGGRVAIAAVLEEWPMICSVVVAASSMIMIGITLYHDWPQ
jgi:hypothetical protein